MAKTTATKSPKKTRRPQSSAGAEADGHLTGEEPVDRTIQGPVLGRANYTILGVALLVITIGFIALGQGSITLAPILLVTGYLVLIPVAIFKRVRSGE